LYCGKRFTTLERVESAPLMVVKADGRREPFSRDKLRDGVNRSLEKRPVPPVAVEKLIAEVELGLEDFVLEVPSAVLGERVLKRLFDLDPVAYVRFASVHRGFESVDDFLRELQRFRRNRRRARSRRGVPAPPLIRGG
jgi:transcriptional repressor NrdR